MAANHTAIPASQARLTGNPYARLQRGVYAVEWAIIFPVFFALLYTIISYGLTFLVRESMQYAVEEGARAALRYPSSSVLKGALADWHHRKEEAQLATVHALEWLPANLRPTPANIDFRLCQIDMCDKADETDPIPKNLECSSKTPCMVIVGYRVADYRTHAIAPDLPGLGWLLPDSLSASASILIDRGML